MATKLKELIKTTAERGQGTPYGLSITAPAPDLPERAGLLSEPLQVIARQYIGARQRHGETLLDAARWMSEAKQIAKHGEWLIFLEATGTSTDTAKRLLDIHAKAMQIPQFAEFVRNQWIGQSAAALLSAPSTPPEIVEKVLRSGAPAKVDDIKKEIKEAKQRTPKAERATGAAPDPAAIQVAHWQAQQPNIPEVARDLMIHRPRKPVSADVSAHTRYVTELEAYAGALERLVTHLRAQLEERD